MDQIDPLLATGLVVVGGILLVLALPKVLPVLIKLLGGLLNLAISILMGGQACCCGCVAVILFLLALLIVAAVGGYFYCISPTEPASWCPPLPTPQLPPF